MEECKKVQKGIAYDTLVFLKESPIEKAIDEIFLKDHNRIYSHWRNTKNSPPLSSEEFVTEKDKYLKGADAQLILYAKRNKGVTVVTEESKSDNDNKSFKKIPLICKHEEIPCVNLPQMIKNLKPTVTIVIPKSGSPYS